MSAEQNLDLAIAEAATLRPIAEVAAAVGIPPEVLEPYGRHMAKVPLDYLADLPERADARLVLVTAMSPTPPGEGKTTTTIGLGDGLRAIGEKAMVCLREPSMGPVFGMKGGATGGGQAQVAPMVDINLHFTGDFAAIGQAANLLAALIDNDVHHGNALDIDVRRITWRRAMDMNDRALREVIVGIGGAANGYPREDGFDIVVASEVMAVFCLATSLADLKDRLARMVVATTRDGRPVQAGDLHAEGAMTALLVRALAPNLVQTLAGTPALVHGGPFANIAHGCNSLVATKGALRLADYVVTEAGFGADLGAEKFLDIACRQGGIMPAACVVVATVRALKHHGGATPGAGPDPASVTAGLPNLRRHARVMREVFGLPTLVCLNHFDDDTAEEVDAVRSGLAADGVDVVVARHWADGPDGATDLARAVVALASTPADPRLAYPDEADLWAKAEAVARQVYGASGLAATPSARRRLDELQDAGYGHLQVCIAKTPYSFSTDATLLGAPSGHVLDIREVRLSAGAGFVVLICGDVMTMPGLPVTPGAHRIDVVDGRVTGLQ
jgi:formate--tetrahydrofolate ligase